ncbi:hypothetical protein AOLI_G00286910 [Acnodon oligacanthus]
MSIYKVTVGLLALLLVCSVRAEEEENSAELSVGELLERANSGIVRGPDEPKVVGDIAVDDENDVRNADPCTSRGCMWPKSSDGWVYVPFVIANHFTSRELQVIQRGLDSFSSVSCIRFTPRSNQRDYISIESNSGCYSYVGRLGYAQTVSLDRNGCIYHNTVQHELLHALGFNHEQCRSDRDNHIRVVWENIIDSYKYAFDKINTLNQGTPYDYNSVMQYHRTAFSKNGQPTMVPIPNSNVSFGQGTQMSQNDITRLNRLYQCFFEDASADLSVGELLERANRNIIRDFDEPELTEGDIAIDNRRNADPCTSTGCMWPKSSNGKVYVPYVIANHYSSRELQVIQRGLDSFSSMSCIQFRPRSNERDYLSIESRNGCYSYVGRLGNAQTVSLDRNGCIYHNTVQHELLHALGFNHEQTRNDRDNHIRVVWENIIENMKHNFDKINTLNQGTPYDYNSVMQYHRTAFSKNGQPTMIPIPNSNVPIGQATQMSQNDITRLNRLYKCSPDFDEPELTEGDTAVDSDSERNADPCTSSGCMWPKSSDGKVYVPYVIANHYSSRELQVIQRGLDSFSSMSCIRFNHHSNERDYLSIESHNGCYSYVGHCGNAQTVSLACSGCIYHKTVKHELLHALGFNHEKTRSDRDNMLSGKTLLRVRCQYLKINHMLI